jgi:hypothetical protein
MRRTQGLTENQRRSQAGKHLLETSPS